jgi:hypothetical protein
MLLALSLLSISIPSADSEEQRVTSAETGACGDDMHWAVSVNGQLFIYGSGDSWDYSERESPLEEYKDLIVYIKVDFGVRNIDPLFLEPCQNVTRFDVGRDMETFIFGSDALEEVDLAKRISEESGYLKQFSARFGDNLVVIYEDDLVRLGDQNAKITFKWLRGTDIPVDLRTVVGYDTLYEFRAGDLTEFVANPLISLHYDSALHFKIMHLQPDYLMSEGVYYNYYITFTCDEPGYLLMQVQKKTFIPYPELVGAILVLFFTICGVVYYRRVLRRLES